MDSRQSDSYLPLSHAKSESSQQRRQASLQHASEGPQSSGARREQYTGSHHSSTGSSTCSQTWKRHNAAPSTGPNYRAAGQWAQQQQQQQPWGFFNTGYTPTAAFPQYSAQSYLPSQQQTWQQQYPQYGHFNPAFFSQQPVANTHYSANSTSGYGGPDTGYGAAYNARQQQRYDHDYDYWSDQVPVANSQAQAAVNQPHNDRLSAHRYQNALAQPQNQPQQTSNLANFPIQERYENRVSQLGGLMNPLYMRSPQLTPSGETVRQYLLPHPKPSSAYLEQAKLPPRCLSDPKKLLIVLDLNGTLLVRKNRGSSYIPRPHVQGFLAYCLEHHALMVWSSARSQNVAAMVAQLFTDEQRQKLVAIWSRDHLRLGVHFETKVQVYKQLTWLWEDARVQASFPTPDSVSFKVEDGWKEPPPTKWDQSNTVLLDDSVDKAASEPHNLIRVDEFTKEHIGDGEDVLGRVLAYIEDLKCEADVSRAMRERPFVNGQGERSMGLG